MTFLNFRWHFWNKSESSNMSMFIQIWNPSTTEKIRLVSRCWVRLVSLGTLTTSFIVWFECPSWNSNIKRHLTYGICSILWWHSGASCQDICRVTGICRNCLRRQILKICKGQLVSKCPLRVIVWNKIPSNFFPGFLP